MSLATLAEVLQPALKNKYAVGGLVCLGWEDSRAYVAAAEAENAPVILQAGPGCRAHTPLPVLAAMFRHLAEAASVPVVAHLDHGYTVEECREAIECGFTSVMFDGSRKPLSENIDLTAQIAEMAHNAGISCEGEIGFVGYSDGENSLGTDPEGAAKVAVETKVDAMAISVGNVHLQQNHEAELDRGRIDAVQSVTNVPLVIHGGSGVPHSSRLDLARNTSICKFNIGTELRMAFGQALRQSVEQQADQFDRVKLLEPTESFVKEATQAAIQSVGSSGRAV